MFTNISVQNATQLGLNTVSRPYIDDEDGLAKKLSVTLTPSRSVPRTSRPHANLVSLHLAYIWKTVGRRKDAYNSSDMIEEVNPFSSTLYLPTESLLTRVTEQFLTYHFVGRYPLIFGPWCKRLDLEMDYFPSIGRSIGEIMNRSKNPAFISKCKRLLKAARSRHNLVLQASSTAIYSCTRDDASEDIEWETEDPPSASILTNEEVLCESLEQLFRVGVPQRRFKPTTTYSILSLPQEDDDDLVQSSRDGAIVAAGTDCPFSWLDLPDIAMFPPLFGSTDIQQTLPDDMDDHVQEDWPEDEDLWRTHEDTSQSYEHDFETPSDESLISLSDSSASITTPASRASFPAHYHENEDDYRGARPGALQCGFSQEGAFLEDSENSALFTSLAPSVSHHAAHDRFHSQSFAHLTMDQELDVCQAYSGGFEVLDSPVVDGSLDVGYEESDSILFELDEMMDSADNILPVDFSFDDTSFSPDVTQYTNTSSNGEATDDSTDVHYTFTLSHQVADASGAADWLGAEFWDP
ncbi:hypothetical protein HYDPIDRAFT_33170 [Hydnomerulius pinastri MD-312]|uniref:Uncharacterized protein n=1 Tax=Hydnomerulius pinastri MD-312 TaxID=994086 RepID=A0A0C9W9E3_9AGAM|nr:hypothetical protein HYDPIDRAFT_33170 [Hydnomerulius pinastri MD-312]